VPATGGWQTWQTVTASVSLAAGSQTIQIYAVSNGWNFNWFEIAGASSATPPPTSGGSTIHVEAENWTTKTNAPQNETTTDVGGGQDVGYIGAGDWMNYNNVNVAAAGTYTMSFRVASPNGGQLQVKNSSGTVLATVSVPATGGWQTWQTVTASVSLAAGSQTIQIYAASNGWNFNWFEIAGAGASTTSAAMAVTSGTQLASSATPSLSIYPNPISSSFQLQINNTLTGAVSVQVYDMSGGLQTQFSLTKTDTGSAQYYLSIGQLAAANYIIKVTMTGWTQSQQISKQ
jgi:endoglucanase